MNLPNKLTILRIVLVPLFVALLLIPAIPYNEIWAILVFSLASLTDMLDGRIARKHGLVTDFGKFADPVADKILTMSAFVCFVALGWADAALVIIILAREFIVTSSAWWRRRGVIAANPCKAKTVSQIFAILLVLALQAVNSATGYVYLELFWWIGFAALCVCTALTLISGGVYLWKNRSLIKNVK
ncbi:MAG: CDP-diacylglycerol--glycerol-3-phosphate 3-phosphatidyltransferase [[Clostridium] leptum]